MIVKNESKIIGRMLTSVLPLIDTYCICDTGSTDDTIEVIRSFFDQHNITGKVVTEPFRNFGYNRTYSLNQCNGMPNSDYLLLMDADMILEIPSGCIVDDFKRTLTQDAYYLFQGTKKFFYKNVRIVKNYPDLSYWGVTHEYIDLPKKTPNVEIPRSIMFINDVGDGGSKTDKFVRDIKLLKQGLVENPNNVRYTFYLANSYKCAGQYKNAIETYKKRIALGGWEEEVWYSYYIIGKCYKTLNDMPNAIFYWMEGYQYYPDRIENLYEIVKYYRLKGQNLLAYRFYEMADYHRTRNPSTDHLFYYKDIYDYKLDYEFSIVGYYCNYANLDVNRACMKVLNNPAAEPDIQHFVMKNYKYYVNSICDIADNTDYVVQLNNIQIDIDLGDEFVSSTPSIYLKNDRLYINTRFVNYRIDNNGVYSYKNSVTTKNIITILDTGEPIWKKIDEFVLKYDEKHDGLYVGIEDVRVIVNNENLYYNANRGLAYKNIKIETGVIDISNQTAISSLVTKEDLQPVEKNWVLFKNNNQLKVIYQWHPLIIGDYEKQSDDENTTKFMTTNTIDTPHCFKRLRGSTNGIAVEGDIWFIAHIVSHEGRRCYYHVFVVLDQNTYKVKRYSRMFSFEKQKIEYTLGFVYMEQYNQFLIGYSTNDSTTNYIAIDKKKVDGLF